MKKALLPFSLCLLLLSCKNGKEETPSGGPYISVVSLIKSQVAMIDTSLFSIIKVVQRDSLFDTSYIARENFAAEAKDFLEIPDLADPKVAKRYKASEPIHDQSINRVIFSYTPVDFDKEEVKKQEFLATPIMGADAKINNIIIVREISTRDSFLQKKMLWQMDKSFQVVTTSQKPGTPEVVTTTRVIWNEGLQ